VDRAREARTLASPEAPGKGPWSADFSPDGLLLASAHDDGVRLWSVADGGPFAFLPLSGTRTVLFHPDGSLIACTPDGVRRWPLDRVRKGTDMEVRIGPARLLLSLATASGWACWQHPGRTLLVADRSRGAIVIFDLESERVTASIPGHANLNFLRASPDGRWVASSTWRDDWDRYRVADIAGRKVVREQTGSASCLPVFSPDGKWLVVPESDCSFLEIGSWAAGPVLRAEPGLGRVTDALYSRDGLTLAVSHSSGVVRLLDAATRHELARLPAAGGVFQVSADGNRLITYGGQQRLTAQQRLTVWDLRRIRRHLHAMGLDWDPQTVPSDEKEPAPDVRIVNAQPGGAAAPQQSSVVLTELPARSRRRPATAEQIAGWIKDLGTERVEAATRALIEVGPPAINALTVAAAVPNARARQQARAVLDRIAVADAVAPTRVRLQLEDAALADALRAFAKQTGIAVKEPSSTLFGPKPRRLNLKLDDVPAWEALDRICDAAGAHLDASNLSSLSVSYRERPSYAIRGYAGPFRLQGAGSSYQRDAGPIGARESLDVRLQLRKEPRARAITPVSLRLTKAQSDDGQDLSLPNAMGIPVGQSEAFGVEWTYVSLPLKGIDRRGGTIKVLKGVLALDVMVRPIERVVVPDLAKAQGRTFFGEHGRRLTVLQAQQISNGWNLSLGVAGPPDWRNEPKRCGFELVDARDRPVQLVNPLHGPYPLRTPQPEDAAWMAASPLAPSLLAVPWTAFAVQSRRPTAGQWQGNFWVNSKEPLQAPVRLRFYDCEYLRTEVPFELRDVPLP
jgi:hypothetical protein